ncbi:hypothetical protein [Fusobacterium varium]|jgi:hypothetical protein|uniref:Uncharacterized protein n=1 Tax=Fusobacterium varium ATCC 27725 TaxID=469618 RepID=A0ABM6U376_FUSVA|nr:hypothetical protein [Fusobacterium varium]AVQ30726.1 hypothetical protein C4N18_05675 [Fusobacterium varium ATCC 27725]EES64151.1 hypothetical protein FVAG_02733 [Fusobacterium varium ATCC 27725]MCF0171161.1 hypothetical protein [Fusobacterium varium]MCI6031995.1 hypothetical protein [Fusobacterium varium]MDY4007018.1 hypothetical protein [Fusobacterium varium]
MKFKILCIFLILTGVTLSQDLKPLIITEKQGFNFGTIIKNSSSKKVPPLRNLILNIKGTPFEEIKVEMDDYFELEDGAYITNPIILNNEALILDKNGELDLEIKGNLYIDHKVKAKSSREKIGNPIYVEYKN